MIKPFFLPLVLALGLFVSLQAEPPIPAPLQEWKSWATWNNPHIGCRPPSHDPNIHWCFWPTSLSLDLGKSGGTFEFVVETDHETVVPLPGGSEFWPQEVKVNGQAIAVTSGERKTPSVRLKQGKHHLNGRFYWSELPQRLDLPRETGFLTLRLEGKPVDRVNWDAEGRLWLVRQQTTESARDEHSFQVYRLLEDGIPMWLKTRIDLRVSGRSREETLGVVLPPGWILESVQSGIPAAIDANGVLKVQVRPGRWNIGFTAYRSATTTEIGFTTRPRMEEELIAFKAAPGLRSLDLRGGVPIDASQTNFPEVWRAFPVFQWMNTTPLKLDEKLRGMGERKAAGLSMKRQLWLDEKGKGWTYQDHVSGAGLKIWRLDAPTGVALGSVKINGQPELITKNPTTGESGVEVRQRALNLEAVGRLESGGSLRAVAWSTGAEQLNINLNLPPGWRLMAAGGAEEVHGDWLTRWTLFDLFLLLITSLSVYKLWGRGAGVIAFLAYGMTYFEPGAPQWGWPLLLIPIALLRVIPEGKIQTLLQVLKWGTLFVLLYQFVLFSEGQIKAILYPQLRGDHSQFMNDQSENQEVIFSNPTQANQLEAAGEPQPASMAKASDESDSFNLRAYSVSGSVNARRQVSTAKAYKGKADWANMSQVASARIQTGPGIPEWRGASHVSCAWKNPIPADHRLQLFLLSPLLSRLWMMAGLVLSASLLAILLGSSLTAGFRKILQFRVAPAVTALFLFFGTGSLQAELPSDGMLKTLEERLLKPSEAFPHAASISQVDLKLSGDRVSIAAEIHVAAPCAVPLPGKLPGWSPLSVTVNGKSEAAVRREEGHLWIALMAGVSRVTMEGMLPAGPEWECAFRLKPHRVVIQAPGWNVSGVNAQLVPESSIVFSRKPGEESVNAAIRFESDLHPAVLIERHLELGQLWRVRTVVTRIGTVKKAVALQVPLIVGERLLNADLIPVDGKLEARLGASEHSMEWISELTPVEKLELTSPTDSRWVERWHLQVSPIWNVTATGIAPTFESSENRLDPLWLPWPGESVSLRMVKAEGIPGATTTIHHLKHQVEPGRIQRKNTLSMRVQSSLGGELPLGLMGEGIEIESLNRSGSPLPVRREGTNVILPLQPGDQEFELRWNVPKAIGFRITPDRFTLPVEASNYRTTVTLPQDRWILLAGGPQQGPAVRYWSTVVLALIGAWLLSRWTTSPLRFRDWLLLGLGLTQAPLMVSVWIVGWFVALARRSGVKSVTSGVRSYNFQQMGLVILSLAMVGGILFVVSQGLLGTPEMTVEGNGSSAYDLRWYQARGVDPAAWVLSAPLWLYRVLMLLWALWLAQAFIGWLKWGWEAFNRGGLWRHPEEEPTPPPLP